MTGPFWLFVMLLASGLFILVYGMWLKAARNARMVRLFEKAMENGIDPRNLKDELDEDEQGDPHGNLKAGIILLATALAIVLAVYAGGWLKGPLRAITFAFIPGGIGLACMFIHFAIPRKKESK